MRGRVAALTLLLSLPAHAQTSGPAQPPDPLASLSGLSLGGPKLPAGAGVEVLGWIEREAGRTELVLSLTPTGGAKLVADPGVLLRPLPGLEGEETAHIDTTRDYFEPPLLLRLPVEALPGQRTGRVVEYAYCITGVQCLFGESVVELTVPQG